MPVMALQKIQHKLPGVLRETITSLCRNMVEFESDLIVEGLLGVTLDSSQILLVSINERLTKPSKENGEGDYGSKKSRHDKRERKKRRLEQGNEEGRKSRSSTNSPVETCASTAATAATTAPNAKERVAEVAAEVEEIRENADEKLSEKRDIEELDATEEDEQAVDISLDMSLEIPVEFKNSETASETIKNTLEFVLADTVAMKETTDKNADFPSSGVSVVNRASGESKDSNSTDSRKGTVDVGKDIEVTEQQALDPDVLIDTDGPVGQQPHLKKPDANPLEVLQNEVEQLESNLKISSVWSDSPQAVDVKSKDQKDEVSDGDDVDDDDSQDGQELIVTDQKQELIADHPPEIDLNLPVTHGFEVLKDVDPALTYLTDSDKASDQDGATAAAVPCSKDAEVAETMVEGDAGKQLQSRKKRRRKSKSDGSSYSGSSGDSDSSSDDSDERSKSKRKKQKKTSSSRAQSEGHADSPQSTGSEVEFVAIDRESSSKNSAKKKRRESKDNEDLIILDDSDTKDSGKPKTKDLDIQAMIAGVVKSTMGKFNMDGPKGANLQKKGLKSPVRALGTITPVAQSTPLKQPQPQMSCQFCGHKFTNMRLLSQHRQMDKCTICGGLFNCPTLRFNHVVRDHPGQSGMVPGMGAGLVRPSRGIPRGRGQRGGLTPYGMTSMAQPVRQMTPMTTNITSMASSRAITNYMNVAPSTSAAAAAAASGGKNFRVVTAKKCRDCGGLYSVGDFERHQSECPAVTSQKKKKHMCPCGIGYRQAKNFNSHIEHCLVAQTLGTAKISD